MTNSTSDSTSDLAFTSVFTSSSVNLFENQSDEPENPTKPCLFRSLSDRDKEIRIIQGLPSHIEPNHEVSDVVSRAIASCAERVNRQIEIIENEFKLINDNTERCILNASRALDVSLNVIDRSLSDINDRNLDDLVDFDLLRQCIKDLDQLIDNRNQNVNDFMGVLRQLEKQRTVAIENCYRKHISAIKKLSNNSFERLYEKYIKNYNAIKLGNFRTYEELRFKLIQQSGSQRQNYALKARNVKLKIKRNIADSFKSKFITATDNILSDKISFFQKKSFDLVNDLSKLFNTIIQESGKQLNYAIILESSAQLKIHLENLDILDNMMSRVISLDHGEILEDIQVILIKTVDDFNKSIMDSDERLSAGEYTAFNNEMFTEAIGLQKEKIKTILNDQLLLRDIKDAIKVIGTVLNQATEIYCDYLKRLVDSRNTVLTTIQATFKINDSKLKVFENNFDVKLESLIQASNENDVRELEQKCYKALKYIKAKIISNQDNETEVVSNYRNLMISELTEIRSEIQRVFDSFPTKLNLVQEFKNVTLHSSWAESIKPIVTNFKTTVINCQNALHKNLSTLIIDLTSSDLLDNECAWTTFIRSSIDERFNVAMELFENLITKGLDDIANNRIDEIKKHQYLLEYHINDTQNTSDTLKEETEKLFDEFILLGNDIHTIFLQYDVNELSISELTQLIKEGNQQIDLFVSELENRFKLHYENIESKYQAMANSTEEFKVTIKTFLEGGNYSMDEATNALDILNGLSDAISNQQSELMEFQNYNNDRSIIEIKKSLSKDIQLMNIELDKKVYKQKYYMINKIMKVAVNQEILNLNKMLDYLRMQLQVFKKTFEKKDIAELSKFWSDILLKTMAFVDYLLETHIDIKALMKPHIVSSIWNSKSRSAFISSKITMNSTNTFVKEKLKFYDYCKTLVTSPEPIDSSRFLKNIYLSIFQYTMESQENAAELAVVELKNYWTNEALNPSQIYHEIMEEVVKRCKTVVLQTELVWIFKLLEFFDFLNKFQKMEMRLKNFILMTYHEDSVIRLNEAFDAFEHECLAIRETSKTVREKFYFKLKPSHGHPNNSKKLFDLLSEFGHINSECSDTLSDVCNRTEIVIKRIMENYELECPIDILKAATLFIKCRVNLRTKLDSINGSPATINTSDAYEAISVPLATKITDEQSIEIAMNTAKRFLQQEVSAVFWPDNTRLWTENVRKFSTLCRDRCNDIQNYSVREKSKLVDWATSFVEDVERMKEFHR